MARMVLGIFSKREGAEEAINELEGMGYNPKDVSIIMQDKKDARKLAEDTGAEVVGGAASGAATGGALGALAGFLVGSGIVPGLGALLIGGPIAAALGLSGVAATTVSGAATGVLAGGLVGALVRFGIPRMDAEEYEESVKRGGILLIVPTKIGEEEEVRLLMEEYGASQVKAINRIEEESAGISREDGSVESSYGQAHYHQIRGKGRRRRR